MSSSDARRLLSQLTEAFGTDGMLVVRKAEPGAGDGADLVPGSGLRWPECRCGQPVCPDYRPPDKGAEPDNVPGRTRSC
ncbi:hypothetical protein [Streptomyces liangshanensis]|uniref:hypothetical protein n=1 Tax=Streptomyces liangshanensis TaxID=2717324 RepID=UPI0036D775CF